MNTLISLDKDKVHILAVPTLSNDQLRNLDEYLKYIHEIYDVKIIPLGIEVTGALSKEMTDKEFEELKEAIKSKKSINDALHTPLN
jgi:hypothetical protein